MTFAKIKVVKPIPKGWCDLKPFNQTIDVFLPFKIPLRDESQEGVNEDDKFTWSLFREKLQKAEKRMVAVIDLVPHAHYYFVEEMVQHMGLIPYYKLGCKGGNHLPNDSIFARFCETVKHVVSSRPNWGENDFIGVHCCKGVNRTGFMICKYLITRKNYEPAKAIELFSSKRECQFDREKYVEHLLTLTSDQIDDDCVMKSSENSVTSEPAVPIIYSISSSPTSQFAFKTRCNSSGSDTSKEEEKVSTDKKTTTTPTLSIEHSE